MCIRDRAGSYAALEEILDNVGCAIYVTDQTTGRMLFANQILKNTFAKELLDHNFDALLQSSVRKEKTKSVSVVSVSYTHLITKEAPNYSVDDK